jgi:hypothetical protein
MFGCLIVNLIKMKRIIIVHFVSMLFLTASAQTEWTTSGTNIYNTNSGNVGIGINAPTEKLTVSGNIKLTGGILWDWPNRVIEKYADPDGVSQMIRFRNSMAAGYGNPNGGFDFADHLGASVMRINNYSVGIGTVNTGSFKLAVEGKIGAREIRVTSVNPWPDYVFSKQYKLKSLSALKEYISKNHRLPEMPSAQEVKDNGIELGKMNAKLLEKIEELTLYVIELKGDIEQLKKERR